MLAVIVAIFAAITVFANEDKEVTDAMTDIEAALAADYRVSDGVISIADDGYIGIPVELSVYLDKSTEVVPGVAFDATPIAVYVVNSKIERIGTDTDVNIIKDMLERGYMVVILDYLNNSRAVSPDLDWSVQGLRASIKNGKYFDGIEQIPKGSYPQNLTVPAGYTAEFNLPYWEIDKHCADGTLEFIVSVWNNDFRNYFAHRRINGGPATIVKWVDENGNRKATRNGYDGSSAVWYSDPEGKVPSENGIYVDIEYTLAQTITDCVKADGSPMDLSLYMHMVYPTSPAKEVPVMCLAGSGSHTVSGTQTADRPQLNGYVFNGYAGITFDYGYVPMERDDHYGFFDVGSAAIGQPTGDGVTYSVQFYNDKKINTAAMRFIRYLSLSEPETYCFDKEAIGVYGNSKGGWMVFLGEEHPELMAEEKIFEGHSGETRYEAGLTETVGIIDGGEKQPWLEYGGEAIDSGADFIFSSCGTGGENITEAHAPTFITANLNDPTYYQTSNEVINACRAHNVPTVWFEVPLGHTLGYGKDMKYGTDVYDALFAFSGYYMKGDAVSVLYVHRDTDYTFMPTNAPIIVKFSGAVPSSEIAKITVKDGNGRSVSGEWSSLYGNTEWTFKSETLSDGTSYTLTVPAGIVGDNGLPLAKSTTYSFEAGYEIHSDSVSSVSGNRGTYYYFTVPDVSSTVFSNGAKPDSFKFRIKVENEASNVLAVRSLSGFEISSPDSASLGSLIDTVYLYGKGYYDVNVTELVEAAKPGDTVAILLTELKTAGETTVLDVDFENGLGGIKVTPEYEIIEAPDGSLALSVSEFPIREQFRDTHPHYVSQNGTLLTTTGAVKSGAVSADDLGRRFTVSFRIYDTVSRYVQVGINGVTSSANGVTDYNVPVKNIITKAGEWVNVELEYTVYDTLYENAPLKTKTLTVSTEHTGLGSAKLYIDDVKSVETVTNVNLANSAELLISTSEQRSDPYMTKYGRIPVSFFDDVEKYPLLVFNKSGECVLGTDVLINTSTSSALGYAQTQTDVDLIVLLRDDYVWSGEVTNNLSFIKGNVLIDLGGNTLTATTTVFNAQGKRTFPTNITVINGELLLENKPLIDVTGVNISTYDYNAAVKQFNFLFDGVKIGYVAGATGASIVKNSWSSAPTNASVIFNDCTFDLYSNAPSALSTLFALSKIDNDYIHTTVKLIGGSVVAKDMSSTSIATVKGDNNAIELEKNENGKYTVLRIAEGGSATKEVFVTEDGYCTFSNPKADAEFTEYSLAVDSLATPYGLIPAEYASVSSYPVVYFHKNANGSYTFSNAAASFFASEYASRSKDAVMFVRANCTVTTDLNNFGLHKNLTVDLNNKTVTFQKTMLIRPTVDSSNGNSNVLGITFKNGNIVIDGSGSFLYRANSTKTENTENSLTFENVRFYKTAASKATTPFVTHENFAVNAKININYIDCIFDLSAIDYSASSLTLFKAGDSAGGLTETVTVSGGSVITNQFKGLTLADSANASSKVIFAKGTNGEYTALSVEGGSAPSGYFTSENGERLAFIAKDDGTYVLSVIFSFINARIRLNNDISVLWAVQVPEGYSDVYATFKLGNGALVTVTDYKIDEYGRYVFTFCDVTPHKMGDVITASIYADGELQITSSDFSIRSYCEYLLKNYASDKELVAVVTDLLIYGERAQLYVGYKTDSLVTEGLGIESDTAEEAEITNKLSLSSNSADGITLEGIGLVLDSSLAFRLVFSAENAEGLTLKVTVGGRTKSFNVSELAYKNGKYTLIYDGINAAQFDELITVSFERNGEALGTALTYSVNSYVYYVRSINAPENLTALVEAIARYGASAKVYNDSHS